MSEFWSSLFANAKTVLMVVAIVNGSLLALFIILMALPGSKLRSFVLKIFSGALFLGTGVFLLWVVVPDLIPGPVDDVGALIGAVFTSLGGAFSLFQSRKLPGQKRSERDNKAPREAKISEHEHPSPNQSSRFKEPDESQEFEEAEFEEVEDD